MRTRALWVVASALLVGSLAPSRAAADEKLVCARAGETAQELRAAGKLVEAREQLLTCARASCPPLVRSDCAKWIGEVDAATPTIVVRARDAQGGDLRDVRVSIDGAVVTSSLDGQPIAVNPGEHTVRYEHAGASPIGARLLLATGEKNRLLAITFGEPSQSGSSASASAPSAPPTAATASQPAPLASRASGPPALAWVFAGASVVALGSFAYFGATGKGDLDALRANCAGHCAQSDVDRAWTKLIVADASLGVGVVAAGLATWLFLAPRRDEPNRARAEIAPTRDGVTLRWTARF